METNGKHGLVQITTQYVLITAVVRDKREP